jgi:hypothetical protein
MNRLKRGARATPDFSRSESIVAPVVAGWPRAAILVPVCWPEPFDAEEAAAVLVHERAHLDGKHLTLRLIIEFGRGLYWWIPTAALARHAELAFEEIADDGVRLARHDASVLARALVKAASVSTSRSVPEVCPGVHAARDLEGRIRRLVEGENMSRNKKIGSWVASVSFAALGTCFALAAASNGSGRAPSHFGLKPAAVWEYQTTGPEGPISPSMVRAVRVLPFKSRDVVECEVTNGEGRYVGYEYMAEDETGVWKYAVAHMSGPGFARDVAPEPMLKLPLKKGATWTWRSPFRGQVMSDGTHEINMDDLASDCRTTVVSVEESVSVPAGMFKAAHLHFTHKTKAGDSGSSELWIADGIGVVKDVTTSRQGAYTRELTKFTPGTGAKAAIPKGFDQVKSSLVANGLTDTFAIERGSGSHRRILRIGATVQDVNLNLPETVDSMVMFDGRNLSKPSDEAAVVNRLKACAFLSCLAKGANPETLELTGWASHIPGNRRTDIFSLKDGKSKYMVRYESSKAVPSEILSVVDLR